MKNNFIPYKFSSQNVNKWWQYLCFLRLLTACVCCKTYCCSTNSITWWFTMACLKEMPFSFASKIIFMITLIDFFDSRTITEIIAIVDFPNSILQVLDQPSKINMHSNSVLSEGINDHANIHIFLYLQHLCNKLQMHVMWPGTSQCNDCTDPYTTNENSLQNPLKRQFLQIFKLLFSSNRGLDA